MSQNNTYYKPTIYKHVSLDWTTCKKYGSNMINKHGFFLEMYCVELASDSFRYCLAKLWLRSGKIMELVWQVVTQFL